jgi:hypothetical protein
MFWIIEGFLVICLAEKKEWGGLALFDEQCSGSKIGQLSPLNNFFF